MRPQEQPLCQSVTNLVEFLAAYHVPFFIAQEAKHAGSGDDGVPGLVRTAGKHIPREERPLRYHGSIGPLYTLGVEWQVVLNGTHNKVLRNPFFMV
jgi:hypothetical protein